jgi:tetratricopeptide (TPR) repeat protein
MNFNREIAKADTLFKKNYADSAEIIVNNTVNDLLNAGLLNEWAINALGYQYMEAKQLDMASELFLINTRHFPRSANAWDSLGEIYYETGKLDAGIQAYQESLRLNPQNQNAQKMLKKMTEQNPAGDQAK